MVSEFCKSGLFAVAVSEKDGIAAEDVLVLVLLLLPALLTDAAELELAAYYYY
jgi:hypothetical protein